MYNYIDLDKVNLEGAAPEKEPERQYYFMAKVRELVAEQAKELGHAPRVYNLVVGCQMNAKDSEKLLGILREVGYEETESEDGADLVIYNTCTVRENANQKVYGRLGYLNSLKRLHPHMMIALCGCMMQEPTVVETIKKSYRFVDMVFGTHNIFKLAEILYQRMVSKKMVIDIWEGTTEIVEDLPAERKYPFKSGVNIMFGCNNFCSYCIVPYVRGRERSRNPEDIIHEIEGLVADGVVEVMLLGQNVNSYGKTLKEPISFAQLLRRVEQIEGLERIRFMTSHPKDLSDELIEVMKESKKICRHLHLPLQSGSTRILREMNRHYTKEQYLALAQKIRTAIPDISITTDVIVGHPFETEELFQKTIETVKEIAFSKIHVFPYSKREGTASSKMPMQVPETEKHERSKRLCEISSVLEQAYAEKYLGKKLEILIESDQIGTTSNYLKVKCLEEVPINILQNVIIKDVQNGELIGEICR